MKIKLPKNIKIAQLEWKVSESQFARDYIASTVMGHYCLMKNFENGTVKVYYNNATDYLSINCSSYDEAKELAQRDFEERVVNCLVLIKPINK